MLLQSDILPSITKEYLVFYLFLAQLVANLIIAIFSGRGTARKVGNKISQSHQDLTQKIDNGMINLNDRMEINTDRMKSQEYTMRELNSTMKNISGGISNIDGKMEVLIKLLSRLFRRG